MKTITATTATLLLAAALALGHPVNGEASMHQPDPPLIAEHAVFKEPAEESEDRPWVPILIISLAIPAAVLIVPSFFGKGGSGGH